MALEDAANGLVIVKAMFVPLSTLFLLSWRFRDAARAATAW